MIRSETEYREAVTRIREEENRLVAQRAKLEELGLGHEEIQRAMDPLCSFHERSKEEVESYERLKRGEFDEIRNCDGSA